jgi:hypothetical protein
MVVGPTNVNPCLRSALQSAMDSGELVGTSAIVHGVGVMAGLNDHMKSAGPLSVRKLIVAIAFVIVAANFEPVIPVFRGFAAKCSNNFGFVGHLTRNYRQDGSLISEFPAGK